MKKTNRTYTPEQFHCSESIVQDYFQFHSTQIPNNSMIKQNRQTDIEKYLEIN